MRTHTHFVDALARLFQSASVSQLRTRIAISRCSEIVSSLSLRIRARCAGFEQTDRVRCLNSGGTLLRLFRLEQTIYFTPVDFEDFDFETTGLTRCRALTLPKSPTWISCGPHMGAHVLLRSLSPFIPVPHSQDFVSLRLEPPSRGEHSRTTRKKSHLFCSWQLAHWHSHWPYAPHP